VTVHQLPPEEPLSPELVLVLPPELRAQAIAGLGPPVWTTPRPRLRVVELPAPLDEPQAPDREPLGRTLAVVVGARVVQLLVIFVAVTVIILAMSLVAQAFR
jgi:hypothetical protein